LQPPEKRNQTVLTTDDFYPGFHHGTIMDLNGMKGTSMTDFAGLEGRVAKDDDCITAFEIIHAASFIKHNLQG